MKKLWLKFLVIAFLASFGFYGLSALDSTKIYIANNDLQKEEGIEVETQNETKSNETKSEEKQENTTKPIPEQNAEECSATLNSNEKDRILEALGSCAVKNKENVKVQSSLLNLIQNSQDEKIIQVSLLLLSNQKNKEISNTILNTFKENKYQNNKKLEYTASIVLFSTLDKETVEEAKKIYESQQSSEDEILKNLAENLVKKLNL
ncbi:MAG: hypothetical protein ACK4UJ_03595 [Leptonema sp. (in: bacteria)]